MPHCTVCTHPHHAKIDRALVAGTPKARVAKTYGLKPDAIARHWQNHVSEEQRREIAVDLKRERAQETADELNDERLDISNTYESLAKRVGKLIDRAEEAGDDSLALASMEGLRRVLSDIAKMQGKLAQQLTVQVSLNDSPEWITLRDMLEVVFEAHPDAKAMFLDLAQRKRLSIANAQ